MGLLVVGVNAILAVGAIYIVFRSTYALFSAARLLQVATYSGEARNDLRIKFYHFLFSVLCAVIVFGIIMMLWGIPRIFMQHTVDPLLVTSPHATPSPVTASSS